VIGSGNWGTTIAKVVAENTTANPQLFQTEVQMWVYEEDYQIPESSKHYNSKSNQPQKLTYLINSLHENVKYLPGISLPGNVVANPSIEDAAKDATILIFNLPHQFIGRVCEMLKGKILPYAQGISCIKGVDVSDEGCYLFCDSIGRKLGIYCGALSGANIANEVALEKWCETTIAFDPPDLNESDDNNEGSTQTNGASHDSQHQIQPLPKSLPPLTHATIKSLFHRPYFHVRLVRDAAGVSLGGALKNVVALAAGFVEGLGWGDNAKAAVMRIGILEEVKFGTAFFPACKRETFTQESCGVADMITSCSGGRNFRCARMSVAEGLPIGEVEERELNGQKLQGTSTAYEVHAFLKAQGREKEFPLLTAVYEILEGKRKPEDIPSLIEVVHQER